VKYESAVATAEKAVSAAKMKHEKMLKKKQKTVNRIKIERKRYWFEKFDWFVSPEGYLVISGRNAQQNELLVKRYLRQGIDVFVHADLHGAATCVVCFVLSLFIFLISNTTTLVGTKSSQERRR
jgi:predicted ribosome quality control (RQC) complex YloA/Tae2 family protein